MGKCVFRNNTEIEDYAPPYFVVEVNSSHNGDMDTAIKMVDAAVRIGGDCVKFQSWSADTLYSKTYYESNPVAKRFASKFSLSPGQLKELAGYCHGCGIDFSSTPYSEREVDFMIEECNAPFIKIASMEINNLPFLRYIGKSEMPVVLSTGMSSYDEVKRAVEVLINSGTSNMVILHCISIYPAEVETVNLNNILGLRDMYPQYPIGFSDHTYGDQAAVAAVALGSALIEKHMTLDRSKVGMDNGMATEPDELKTLIKKCRQIQQAMGRRDRVVSLPELGQRKNMRRSIVASRNLKKGAVIGNGDITAKRPGTGISPDKMDDIVGKTIQRDIEADTLIYDGDFI